MKSLPPILALTLLSVACHGSKSSRKDQGVNSILATISLPDSDTVATVNTFENKILEVSCNSTQLPNSPIATISDKLEVTINPSQNLVGATCVAQITAREKADYTYVTPAVSGRVKLLVSNQLVMPADNKLSFKFNKVFSKKIKTTNNQGFKINLRLDGDKSVDIAKGGMAAGSPSAVITCNGKSSALVGTTDPVTLSKDAVTLFGEAAELFTTPPTGCKILVTSGSFRFLQEGELTFTAAFGILIADQDPVTLKLEKTEVKDNLASCSAYFERNLTGDRTDGAKTIDPDGAGAGLEPFQVYCMQSLGGYTLVAAAVNNATPVVDSILDDNTAGILNAEKMKAIARDARTILLDWPNFVAPDDANFTASEFSVTTSDHLTLAQLREYRSIQAASIRRAGETGERGEISRTDVWSGKGAIVLEFYCQPDRTNEALSQSIWKSCGNYEHLHWAPADNLFGFDVTAGSTTINHLRMMVK